MQTANNVSLGMCFEGEIESSNLWDNAQVKTMNDSDWYAIGT